MLRVRDLTVSAHGKLLLSEIAFEAKRGEAVAVIGPNESGKSLLLQVLAGGVRSAEGDIRINSYHLMREDKQYKSQLGYAALGNQPEEYLTGLEWLEILGTTYAVPPKKRAASILSLAEQLGVRDQLYTVIEHLGPAARQKINIISSLFHEPTVVFWDEPTQFLDQTSQDALSEIAHEFTENGGTLLFSSNHLQWAEKAADRFLFINGGQVVADGTLAHLRNFYRCDERTLTSIFDAAFHG